MRRPSIAASVQTALLGLTVVLAAVAAIGVASLYSTRQTYEDDLSDGLRAQAGAARLLAAGVIEEATLRLSTGADAALKDARARGAFDDALAKARVLAGGDKQSLELIDGVEIAQAALRANPGARNAPLAARNSVARLSARQAVRIDKARRDARRGSRRALEIVIVGGGLALLLAIALVTTLLGAVRRPLEDLVDASRRLADGDRGVRVRETGPAELQALARSFNAMAQDIQAATERLESERRRLDVTVRSLGDALVIVDVDGTVSSANPRAADLVPELARGVRTGEGGVPLPAPLEDALADEVSVERDGRTLAVTAAILEQGSGTVWTVRDVSERARLERLKSEFVSTASHELRSPLTSIKGFVELLADSKGLDARQKEFVDIIKISTERLVDLVNDLLDVARVEAGGLEIFRRPTRVGDVIGDVTRLLGPRIEGKSQRLVVDVAPDTPAADADPERLRQILMNLLTNAHLYTDAGGTLTVSARGGDGDVLVSVADTGRGMTPAELEHVFERFYRAAEGGGERGSGLGLSIVRSLVDLHDGHVEVTSAKGEGTTFTVHLPCADARRSGPAPSRELLRGRRVLVVDDEPEVAAFIAAGLQPYGVDTEVVSDGEKALGLLAAGGYDAVTLDLLMPGMSGFDVLRRLRSDPEMADLPVVVISVFSGPEAISGEWMVAKPIDSGELADVLSSAIGR